MPRKKKSVLEEEEEEDVFGDNEDVDTSERDNFYKEVNEFMEKRGTPIPHDNLPQLGGRRLNVFKLWLQVWGRGGYEAVCENKQWTEVRDAYQVPKTCTSASYSLKMYYQKWLYPYEQVIKMGHADPMQKQTPKVLEQQKQQAATAVSNVKKVTTPAKKRVFPSTNSVSSSTTTPSNQKIRKVETPASTTSKKQIQHKKQQNISIPSNLVNISNWNKILDLRKQQIEQEYSISTVTNVENANIKQPLLPFRIQSKNETLQKEIEYLKRIECCLQSNQRDLIEWGLNQVLKLSQNEKFKINQFIGLFEVCEKGLVNHLNEKKKLENNDNHDDDLFNTKGQYYLQTEHESFIITMILRNGSYIFENQPFISNQHKIIETLVDYLKPNNNSSILHIEWRLRIIDILMNISRFINIENILKKFIEYTLNLKNDNDSLLLTASCIEFLNQIATKSNLSSIEKVFIENPKFIDEITSLLITATTLPKIKNFENIEEEEEEEIDNNENNNITEDEMTTTILEKKKKEIIPTLSEIELLCRISAINFLLKICQLSSNSKFIEMIAMSNNCIERLISLIIWKSNLYNRIAQCPYKILEQIKENEKEKRIEINGEKIFSKGDLWEEEYDEKLDIDELYDGYDGLYYLFYQSLNNDENNNQNNFNMDDEGINFTDSQKFQRKCAQILHTFNEKVQDLRHCGQFATHNQEFLFLMLFCNPHISKMLAQLIQ
ncbi:hypothetical protein ABK040_000610 [Willaertia magna]